jgi:hypothetical protein
VFRNSVANPAELYAQLSLEWFRQLEHRCRVASETSLFDSQTDVLLKLDLL